MNTGTKIMYCGCNSPYQDSRYGLGKRVHNGTKTGWRCGQCKDNKA